MKGVLLAISFLLMFVAHSQRTHLGVFAGGASYNGDLTEKYLQRENIRSVFGVSGHYEITDKIHVRGSLSLAKLSAADKFNDNAGLKARNLSFYTNLWEIALAAEYNILNPYNQKLTPYVFAGIGLYHFNPYSYHPSTTERVYLRPLSTEGQGLPQFPEKKRYALTQPNIPFGGGVRFALTDDIKIGVEGGIRYLFTDHLDDVGGAYIDPAILATEKGSLAAAMSYRGGELPGGNPLPNIGSPRGGSQKDMYFFGTVHLLFRIGWGEGKGDKYLRCPAIR